MASPASAAAEAAATSSVAVLDSSKASSTVEAASSMDLSAAGTSNGGDRGTNEWQTCLDNAVNAIVNIRVLQVKPFEASGSRSVCLAHAPLCLP